MSARDSTEKPTEKPIEKPIEKPMERQGPVDVAVVGAGAAGLYAAIVAAEAGASVRLVSSSPLAQSASYRAQGGLAAAIAPDDTSELHLRDTLAAGRDAARESVARVLCEEAPERVRELDRRGVPWDRDAQGRLLLSLEGGHSKRRVVHAGGSATGRKVAGVLSRIALAHERIMVHERTSAVGLWTEAGRCVGVLAENAAFPARATLLATGGAAALWNRTTNPRGAVGTGLSLAHEAGAVLADLEFLQFHPTALVCEGEHDGFLLTEALRGEGARLLNAGGERFVDELAPRDAVARAITEELARTGSEAVLLDLRHLNLEGFPNIAQELERAGFDPRREPIPVAPAAHYAIGGVATDADGRASLSSLFAVGECACTGVHGANRLASNSLSECFVFGRRAALAAVLEPEISRSLPAPPPVGRLPMPGEATRRALWEHAGLIRDAGGLSRLLEDPYPLARLIASSAIARRESRGCHWRSDFPDTDEALAGRHTTLTPGRSEPSFALWA
jgi:L-aspartate oxidase